jgi:hypothetical protein
LLLGAAERIALFQTTFPFPFLSGKKTPNIPITIDPENPKINVAVVTFFVDDLTTIRDVVTQMTSVPEGTNVYVAGLDAKGTTAKDRTIIAARLKKKFPEIQYIFYAEEGDDEAIIDILIDVVVEVTGVKAK